MNTKARIKRLEDSKAQAKEAQVKRGSIADVLNIKRVNYRAGLSAEFPDPPDVLIKIRHVDIQQRDGDS